MGYTWSMDTNTTDEQEVVAEVVDDTEAAVEEQAEDLLPVAVHQSTPPPELATIPGQDEFRAIAQMAMILAQANLVPKPLMRKPHDVFLVLLTGRDLGIPLTTALRQAYVIDGKVTVAPALRLAKVRQMGLGRVVPHPESDLNHYGAVAVDVNNVALGPPIWFGWEDAQIAGLVDEDCHVREDGRSVEHNDVFVSKGKIEKCGCKDNWKRYPQRMLWWRAAGYCADDYFPEAGLGIYSPDELGAVTDAEGRPIDVTHVEMPPGWEPPTPKEDPIVDEETVARLQRAIGTFTDDEKLKLKAMWTEREFPPLARLPQKFVSVVEAMIVAVTRNGVKSESGQAEPAAEADSGPVEPDAASDTANAASDDADEAWVSEAKGGDDDGEGYQ